MIDMDWFSSTNHIAVNPAQAEAAAGLEDFLTSQALKGLCLFQTSGSEGTPKWVGLTKNAFMISAEAVNAHFEVTAQDHWLIALPLHHVGGFSILARAHLSGSRVTESAAKWNPQEFASLCETEGITLVSLVPTQVHDLVQARVVCPDPLRAAIIGGGGMTQALAAAAMELGWRVFQSYGMTEAASQIATQPYNPFGSVFDVKSLEVLPHWQVATDEGGHLVLSGSALSPGYARQDKEGEWTWEAIPAEGLRTRDRVRLWMHGTRQYLEFQGRDAGYVKILGELVHLAPLQEQIENLARESGWGALPVLLALPDPRAETQLLLITEAAHPDPAPLLTAFHAASPPWLKITRTVQVKSIPRTPLGKVRQEELRQQVAQLGPPKTQSHSRF
ncbi:O-succinylbenzoic acid--CoA ligase [Prosthecobacter fusiformis]|uniref:O-succinylbenzoic acid--CoA ligase n=1 Tax=Prosthecobacter fusiformis TaxID=48464 RepID=A0A4R7S5I8_9BACT|nr:AMP-binding protein [Prosthecobacter fusiformis]TDU73149.1 O-succinylbenzoic acid--CoA ligase [Prosthecobacter fusiformis]